VANDDRKKRRVRPPPKLSKAYLRRCADTHLKRFWPSVAQLRRVLLRRVDRCIAFHGGEREEGAALVEAVLADLLAVELLDDQRFTVAWINDLHRRGISRRAMWAKMATKGVDKSLVDAALAALDERVEDPELARACAYVRRRRLGSARPPHRQPADPEDRRKRREKDLASVCRAGFGFGVALQVIDCDDLAALQQRAGGD